MNSLPGASEQHRPVVRDKAGTTVADRTVTHLYRFVDGLVAMMEIRE